MKNLQTLLQSAETGVTHEINDLPFICNFFRETLVSTPKRIKYYNIPCSFDSEATSIKLENGEKRAFMYVWSFCICGYVILGRTWEEFDLLMNTLVQSLGLNEDKRLIIYVHNLAYDFQFFSHRLKWLKMFAMEKRKPVQAVTVDGIEFRCSYLLSGYSLANLTNQLTKYKVSKLVGDLDYSLIRHSQTPLSKTELQYCINDVLVVVAYIQELIEREGNIAKLPLTKTGFVRNYCRNMCLYDGNHKKNTAKYKRYHRLMNGLTMDVNIYNMLQEAFAGGATHGNVYHSSKLCYNVDSFDLCSAYPAVMMSEKYPMSSARKMVLVNEEQFYECLDNYCCLFKIQITNLEPVYRFENYISVSHCRALKNAVENNGRVVSADSLIMTVTEQDFKLIEEFYTWDDIQISEFYVFNKDYLPRDFLLALLTKYNDKTKLKGVEGKEVEYLVSKENVNSFYGMTVTNPCRDEIYYENNEWFSDTVNIEETLNKYNKSKKRFMFYAWGVWVTAYNRVNLYSAIINCGDDYVYGDTDSVKILNMSNHLDYFETYNKMIDYKIELCCKARNIDVELTRPTTVKGKIKALGRWEHEGGYPTYTRFKFIGAKRYMYEMDGQINLTISGLNKKDAMPYLLEHYKNPFDVFNIDEFGECDLYIPKGFTGKLTHTYIDEEHEGYVTDYLGNRGYYHEYSAVHMEDCDYSFSISEKYLNYILGIREYTK